MKISREIPVLVETTKFSDTLHEDLTTFSFVSDNVSPQMRCLRKKIYRSVRLVEKVLLVFETMLCYSTLYLVFTCLLFVRYCTEVNRYQSCTAAVLFSIIAM